MSPFKKAREFVKRLMEGKNNETSERAVTVTVHKPKPKSEPSRYAVLVGCNYPNSKNELHGCVNDVKRMKETLLERFCFSEGNIHLLIDTDSTSTQPTGANIMESLQSMIRNASPGDVLFFHYSGHGTRVFRPGHESGFDECIVPCDFNLIKDDDFRMLVNELPKGTSFTIVSDSCHSGGLIDKEKEQIGPHDKGRGVGENTNVVIKSRFMEAEAVLEALSSRLPPESDAAGDVTDAVIKIFGEQASPSIKKSASFKVSANEIKEVSEEIAKAQVEDQILKVKVDPDMGILLSGCQSDETSADACPSGDMSQAFGAFSDALQQVFAKQPGPISNKDLVTQARSILVQEDYEQHPCLYCSDANATVAFLHQPKSTSTTKPKK